MIWSTLADLWQDENGSILATEYLMLGSLVVLGGTTGMVAMRDAAVDEMKEYGRSVRNVRQAYSYPTMKNGVASRQGSSFSDSPPRAGTSQQIDYSYQSGNAVTP